MDGMPHLVPRYAASAVRDALADTRVVVIHGARQAGKSTLARAVLANVPRTRTMTLDDDAVRAAARNDPASFVEYEGTLLIDEIQRVPELYLPIKAAVDRDRGLVGFF